MKPLLINRVILLFSFFACTFQLFSQNGQLDYVENKGQFDDNVKFKSQLKNGAVFLEKNNFNYVFMHPEDMGRIHDHHDDENSNSNELIRGHSFKTTFIGCNTNAVITKNDQKEGYYNYFLGNDQSRWASNVNRFGRVKYEEMYADIDLTVYSQDYNLKYDFIVREGGDVNQIKLLYEGLDAMSIRNGDLILETSIGEMMEMKPYAYQRINGIEVSVECEFALSGSQVTFNFPDGYDSGYQLIIDPVLIGSSYVGSIDFWGVTTTHGPNGELYSAGAAFNTVPATPGAFQIMSGGFTDIGICKFNNDASSLIYCTYLGGEDGDGAIRLIVNDNDELFVLGQSASFAFPVSVGAYSTTLADTTNFNFPGIPPTPIGVGDLTITHFNSSGTALIGSTYMGGAYYDFASDIVLDASGNCYVVGMTQSYNFPTTSGVYQSSISGAQDGVVFKMNSDLTSLVWSTLVGGTADDVVESIRIASSGEIFVNGTTESVLPFGGYQTALQGGKDGFVMKFNSNVTTLLAGTYLGSGQDDKMNFMDLDIADNVYICGNSAFMPITSGVYNNPAGLNFIAELSSDLNNLVFSTRIGMASPSGYAPQLTGFNVDECGYIYIGKYAENNSSLPTTASALNTDGFVYAAIYTPGATAIESATYIRTGGYGHGGRGEIDDDGVFSMTFCSGSASMVMTPWAYNQIGTGVNDMGLFKIDFDVSWVGSNYVILANDSSSCGAPYDVDFASTAPGNADFYWDLGDGNTSTDSTFTHSYAAPGTYTITLILTNLTGCVSIDTLSTTITVDQYLLPTVDLGPDTTVCSSLILLLDALNPGATYSWNDGTTNQTLNASLPNMYWVEVTDTNGCVAADTITITHIPAPIVDLGQDTTMCDSVNLVLDAQNIGDTYLWNDNSTNQTLLVTTPGIYWVEVTNSIGCTSVDSIIIVVSTVIVDLGSDTTACDGVSMVLDAQNPGATYLWNDNSTNQTLSVTAPGMYWVEVVDAYGCSSADSINIDFLPSPILDLGNDTTMCDGVSLLLDAQNPGESYLWNDGSTNQTLPVTTSGIYWVEVTNSIGCTSVDSIIIDVSIVNVDLGNDTTICEGASLVLDAQNVGASYLWNDNSVNQTLIVTDAGIYWVEVTNAIGCTSIDSIIIETGLIHASFNPGDISGCAPLLVDFIDQSTSSGNVISWNWDFGDGNNSFIQNPQHIYNSPGSFNVSLSVISSNGCSDDTTVQFMVEVYSNPLAAFNFTPDNPTTENSTVHFYDQSVGAVNWHWDFGDGSISSVQNPIHEYLASGNYTVTLTIENEYGCPSEISYSLAVEEEILFYLPNSFTPDYDEHNQTFVGKGSGVDKFHILIFNRWGEIVFESLDMTEGWDATYNGKIMQDGIYTWKVELRGGNKTVTLNGHVNLIR